MKCKYLICFLCVFFSERLISQENYLDHLPFSNTHKFNTPHEEVLGLIENINHYMVRNPSVSFPLIEKAESISKEIGFPIGLAYSKLAYSNYNIVKGDFPKAMEQTLEALKIFEDNKEIRGIRLAKNNIAALERENRNFDKGIDICLNLISEMSKEPKSIDLGFVYLNAANIFMNYRDDEFMKAKDYLATARNIFKELNCLTGVAMVDVKYGRFYKVSNFVFEVSSYHNQVIKNVNESLTVFEKFNQKENIGYAYYTLASAYATIGKHEESIPFYLKSIDNYKSTKNLIYQLRIYQHLFVGYSILGKQDLAFKANTKYVKIKDTIFNLEKRQILTDAQTRFETQKIKNEKEIAEIQSKRNRALFTGALIISALILLSSFLFLSRIKARKKAEIVAIELHETQKRLALEKQNRDSELKALKSQMNPHFIFNTLNSIQEYILLNQKDLASDYLGKFADLIRNYLHFSDLGFISIADEVQNLKLYLELEKLRFEEELTYSLEIEQSINSDLIKIPTMLIQPYIENALKHGLLHKINNRELYISILSNSETTVKCIIDDNGVGRNKSKELKAKQTITHKSFALKANKNRLTLLNQSNSNKIGVEIIDKYKNNKPDGTKVILTIPIQK